MVCFEAYTKDPAGMDYFQGGWLVHIPLLHRLFAFGLQVLDVMQQSKEVAPTIVLCSSAYLSTVSSSRSRYNHWVSVPLFTLLYEQAVFFHSLSFPRLQKRRDGRENREGGYQREEEGTDFELEIAAQRKSWREWKTRAPLARNHMECSSLQIEGLHCMRTTSY